MPDKLLHLKCIWLYHLVVISLRQSEGIAFRSNRTGDKNSQDLKTQRHSSRAFISNSDLSKLTQAKKKTESFISFLNGSDYNVFSDLSDLVEFVDTSLHKPIIGLKKLAESDIFRLANIDSQKGYVFVEEIIVQQCRLDSNDVHVGLLYQLRSNNYAGKDKYIMLGQGILMIEFINNQIAYIFDVKQSKKDSLLPSNCMGTHSNSSEILTSHCNLKGCDMKHNLVVNIHGNTPVMDFINARNNRDVERMKELVDKYGALSGIHSNHNVETILILPLGMQMEVQEMIISELSTDDNCKHVFVKWHLNVHGVQIKFSRGCSYFMLKNDLIMSGLDILESVKVDSIPIPPISSKLLHHLRDSGLARVIADSLVALGIPSIAKENKTSIVTFAKLTNMKTCIRYGKHPSQIIDLFEPTNPKGLIFFVHGGAWGSGMPWMYRLIAEPFFSLNLAVAVVGYRTYPDGSVQDQVNDLETAADAISKSYPHLTRQPDGLMKHEWKGISLIGHSSGGHISMLMIVEQLLTQLSGDKTSRPLSFDKVFCLSGVFSISDHFQYESGRGVEDLSPMKPACGTTASNFHFHSPSFRLCTVPRHSLISLPTSPNIYVFHGVDDDTVPLSSSRKAVKLMKSWGLSSIQDIYLAEVDHIGILFQLMFGGESKDLFLKYL